MYDIFSAISNLGDNAIAVFCPAVAAYEDAKIGNIDGFCQYLPAVAQKARFWKWREGVAGALRTFCHICLVDPRLVECYLGTSFDELYEEV